jgi:GTPase SAR1 family protein
LPPTVQIVRYKVYLSGKSGVGKSALVSFLCGQPNWTASVSLGETPGVRVTNVYWPTKIQTQLVLFQLSLWDAGETAGKKYGHIQPVCREGAVGALFLFSYSDKSSFDDLDNQLTRLSHSSTDVCPLIVGTRYGAVSESEVTSNDVLRFEAKWNRPVLKVRHQPPLQQQQQGESAGPNPNEVAFVLNLICDQLWCHHHTQQQHRATTVRIDPALI